MRRLLIVVVLLSFFPFFIFSQEAENRPVLAVLDFSAAGVSEEEARIFTDVLSTRIVDSNAFRVIDREQRETILQEIEFSLSDCSDESCQLEVGKLLSASRLVVGSIGRMGSWLIVSTRLVDVNSAQTLRSATEKYLTVEALIDGALALASQVVGQTISGSIIQRPQNAQMLISSVKQKQFEQQLGRMKRRTKGEQYARWLKVNGFTDYERSAALEEKMAFLEEYLYQTNTRGHAVDLALAGGRYGNRILTGITAAWSFQFNSFISAGVSANASMLMDPVVFGSAWLGPILVFGDKVDSFAILVSTGFGGSDGPMFPIRCGLYFRNLYLGYSGQLPLGSAKTFTGIEAGYSLFFGERRTWKPMDESREISRH